MTSKPRTPAHLPKLPRRAITGSVTMTCSISGKQAWHSSQRGPLHTGFDAAPEVGGLSDLGD